MIEFKFGDYPVKRLKPAVKQFPHLPHAPVIIDDTARSPPQEFGEWGAKVGCRITAWFLQRQDRVRNENAG